MSKVSVMAYTPRCVDELKAGTAFSRKLLNARAQYSCRLGAFWGPEPKTLGSQLQASERFTPPA